jgi:hypothetical protein
MMINPLVVGFGLQERRLRSTPARLNRYAERIDLEQSRVLKQSARWRHRRSHPLPSDRGFGRAVLGSNEFTFRSEARRLFGVLKQPAVRNCRPCSIMRQMLLLGVAEVVMKQIADPPDGNVRARIRSNIQRVERVTALSGKDSRKPNTPDRLHRGEGGDAVYDAIMGKGTRARRYHVNLIAPGSIPIERHAGSPQEHVDSHLGLTPMGHFGTPDDIAHAVVFLASERARFITGQKLAVNGGRTLLQ